MQVIQYEAKLCGNILFEFEISNIELDGKIIIKIFLSLSSCLHTLHIKYHYRLKNKAYNLM